MNDFTRVEAMEQVGWDMQMDVLSVYQASEPIEDGRPTRGVRNGVALILTVLLLGTLAGMTSLAGRAQWGRLWAEWLSLCSPCVSCLALC